VRPLHELEAHLLDPPGVGDLDPHGGAPADPLGARLDGDLGGGSHPEGGDRADHQGEQHGDQQGAQETTSSLLLPDHRYLAWNLDAVDELAGSFWETEAYSRRGRGGTPRGPGASLQNLDEKWMAARKIVTR